MSEPSLEGLWAEESPPATPLWVVVFTDLISLVLTFFIMVFAMSEPDVKQWQQVAGSLNTSLNPFLDDPQTTQHGELPTPKATLEAGDDIAYLAEILRVKVERTPQLNMLIIEPLADRLRLRLPSDLLFASGEAVLTPGAEEKLALLADLLRATKNAARITGHTDPSPIATPEFPSNWELSLARAAAVATFLHGAGYQQRVQIAGVADSRILHLPPQSTPEARNMAARRVEIDLMSTQIGAIP